MNSVPYHRLQSLLRFATCGFAVNSFHLVAGYALSGIEVIEAELGLMEELADA